MKIEIELKDSTLCNGCPLLNREVLMKPNPANDEHLWFCMVVPELYEKTSTKPVNIVRPEKCIKENGN